MVDCSQTNAHGWKFRYIFIKYSAFCPPSTLSFIDSSKCFSSLRLFYPLEVIPCPFSFMLKYVLNKNKIRILKYFKKGFQISKLFYFDWSGWFPLFVYVCKRFYPGLLFYKIAYYFQNNSILHGYCFQKKSILIVY